MTESKISQPYGLWKSPVSDRLVSQRLRLSDVAWDSDGKSLLWLEGRSDRGVLVARQGREASRDLTAEHSVRGTVGYGGGDFTVREGTIVFADRSGRLFRHSLGYGQPVPITPPFGSAAAPAISPDGKRVVYVFSDGREDVLGIADLDGQNWPAKLVRGATFYLQPAWHPSGDRLAWVEWDHPNMPWDGTRLMLADVDPDRPLASNMRQIAGDECTPAVQPMFSPDGRYLSYIENRGEWENLVLFDLATGEKRTLVEGEGFTLSLPAWVQGGHHYGWSGSRERIFYTRFSAGFATLWVIALAGGHSTQVAVGPYTMIDQLAVSPAADELAFIGSASQQPNRVVRWNGSEWLVEARSEPETVDPAYLPRVQPVRWNAADGTPVHGMFSPPSNPRYTASGLPPAIVRIHGGPTSAVMAGYSSEVAYFTSRGYAVLEVNYRGSTGYGRSYMDKLREHWGEVDVEDAVGGARALVDQGLADASKLVIMGGSAGGYTVLNVLVRHPGIFKAGVCLYGVSNLFALAMDTHKFEERYNDSMVGALPEAASRYHAWSPIFHVDQIRDPMAIFQGSEDKVVPPDQSEVVVSALRSRGIPHIYRLYEGEGHGFRKSETIADFLQQVERFLQQYVLFSV